MLRAAGGQLVSNPETNVANYNVGANWNGQDFGNVTTAGSAGPLSQSFYGTSDQGGNVSEWTEANSGGFRGWRGGSFNSPADDQFRLLQSSSRIFVSAFEGGNNSGFRVATVPEPGTIGLAVLGALGLLIWARRTQ